MGDLFLWTNFECGFGIIAGSLPMLRKLFKSLAESEDKHSTNNPDVQLVTIGGSGAVRSGSKFKLDRHPYEANITALATVTGIEEEPYGKDRDYDRDSAKEGDDESTRHMIRVTRRIDRKVSIAGLDKETQEHVGAALDPGAQPVVKR